jgi:hypothetical protein
LKKKETGRGHDPDTDLICAVDMWIETLDQQVEIEKDEEALVEARRADAALNDSMCA